MGVLLLIPILFPLLAGIPVFRLRDRKIRRVYVSVVVVVNALLVYGLAFLPDVGVSVWTITEICPSHSIWTEWHAFSPA